MAAYYNEHDRFAAAWLRELIKAGLIAAGDVDERSIEDVVPSELTGYTQCHFFAGIGVWSYALRRAGWPDDRPVWTGSCPCQPFSAAGKGGGFTDERHLWPAFYHLVSQCRPVTVFGEQVASKDGLAWLDLVQADLEGTGYTVGAVDTCAAGFGAPHIRQRLYWVADAQSSHGGLSIRREESGENNPQFERRGSIDGVADADRSLADANDSGLEGWGVGWDDTGQVSFGPSSLERQRGPGPVNGFWGDADWLRCRDDKWRSVRPGSFPLVDVAPARVGRLRGYGNAIVAVQAEAFIKAYLECLDI